MKKLSIMSVGHPSGAWVALSISLYLCLTGAAAEAGGIDALPVTAGPSFDQGRFGSVAQQLHDWHFVIGAGAAYKPEYQGSDKYEFSAIPLFSAQFFDVVTVDSTGVDLKVYQVGSFRLDASIGYDIGRKEDDADELRGMGDVDFGVTVGGKATYEFGPASVFVGVDKTIGGSDGLLVNAGAAVTAPITDSFILGAEASATFADTNYMESYFGVSAAQSARSGHAQYKAEAGFKSVDASLKATWLIDEHWTLIGKQSVGLLVGNAADSPLVKEKFQSNTMLALGYRF